MVYSVWYSLMRGHVKQLFDRLNQLNSVRRVALALIGSMPKQSVGDMGLVQTYVLKACAMIICKV